MRRLLASIALISCLVPAWGRGLTAEVKTLKNGLTVVVVEDHRTPVVTHMVWYKIGASDDTYGKSGLAHFLEHLLFKGTKAYPGDTYDKTVTRAGGQSNAFTSADYTAYYASLPAENLRQVMAMEADRMRNIVLNADNFKAERDVITEERRQRVDNNPGARFGERLNALTFARYPYQTPIIGWMDEINGLDYTDALAFYRASYAPRNAIVVVAGDVKAAEVVAMAEKTFGKLKDTPVMPRLRPAEPAPLGATSFRMTDPRVKQTSWVRVWRAPSIKIGDTSKTYALDVLAAVLGGGETGRLYRALAVDSGLATSAGASYDGDRLGPGEFQISVDVAEGVDVAKAEAAAMAEVSKLLKDGITDAELTRVKRSLVAEAIYAQDSVAGLANIFGRAYALGETAADVTAWTSRIEAVTRDDVLTAARAVLERSETVTGILAPEGSGS